jgi:hypothetical protein
VRHLRQQRQAPRAPGALAYGAPRARRERHSIRRRLPCRLQSTRDRRYPSARSASALHDAEGERRGLQRRDLQLPRSSGTKLQARSHSLRRCWTKGSTRANTSTVTTRSSITIHRLQTIDLWRDRFGVCPLYYLDAMIDVSSEQRRLALRAAREVPAHGRRALGDMRAWCKARQPHAALRGDGTFRIKRLSTCLIDALQSASRHAPHSDSGFSLALSGGLDSTPHRLLAFEHGTCDPLAAICRASATTAKT